MTHHNADELAGPLGALLAYRHGDKKHLTQEHARLLYESFYRHPQQPQGVVVSEATSDQLLAIARAIGQTAGMPNHMMRAKIVREAAIAALPSPVAEEGRNAGLEEAALYHDKAARDCRLLAAANEDNELGADSLNYAIEHELAAIAIRELKSAPGSPVARQEEIFPKGADGKELAYCERCGALEPDWDARRVFRNEPNVDGSPSPVAQSELSAKRGGVFCGIPISCDQKLAPDVVEFRNDKGELLHRAYILDDEGRRLTASQSPEQRGPQSK